MRRILFVVFLFILSSSVFAQTQLGYVKTIGRPGKPGVGVQGVMLRFAGVHNAVLTNANGNFSVNVQGKHNGDAIKLLQLRKNGYELKDASLIGSNFVISSEVPLVISVVSIAQFNADKKRIEDNAYRVADRNYKKKLKALEDSVKATKISADKYHAELQQLQGDYEKYMSLIGDMADRYARTDYDNLDSIDVEINKCIEAGELDKAEELILSVFDPTTVLDRNRAAKKELQERMTFVQQALDKLYNDRQAIMNDIEASKRIAELGLKLAKQYESQGNQQKAKECYQKCHELMRVLGISDNQIF